MNGDKGLRSNNSAGHIDSVLFHALYTWSQCTPDLSLTHVLENIKKVGRENIYTQLYYSRRARGSMTALYFESRITGSRTNFNNNWRRVHSGRKPATLPHDAFAPRWRGTE